MAAVAAVDNRDSIWHLMVAVVEVFDGGSSVRRHPMASAMDYDERMRGRRKDRQPNNQPA